MADIIVSVNLRCPFCGQNNVEHRVAETESLTLSRWPES
jgi:hypothetical protein